ncbi:hypothetical protein [Corynebacterium cystitidis]|uniref:hypothetical protein n=1 Tax=Corynebacterium cystitidis TaxID=35757 RepID=UPI00211ECB83|nr:hypothetical protein [Corynebacterium cystitidis]
MSFADSVAFLAQEATTKYPNYPEWYSNGLPWSWFIWIVAVIFIVGLIITIVLSGKNSRRTGRREGGL